VQKAFKRIEKRKADEAKKYESEGIEAPENLIDENTKNANSPQDLKDVSNQMSISADENNVDDIKPEEIDDQGEKEYTSDSVFAKLNELKKEE
jgi:hypothetical protein